MLRRDGEEEGVGSENMEMSEGGSAPPFTYSWREANRRPP